MTSCPLPTAAALAALLAGCAPLPPAPAVVAPASAAAATAPTPAAATDAPAGFAAWAAGFRQRALAAGITEATLRAAFDGVRHRPRVVELDRAQPEFTRTVWDYLDAAVSDSRVARGQDQLAQLRAAGGEAASARHGVPLPVVVAIWGVESDYGRNYGDIPVVDALATLAFDGRRAEWAQGQLLAALRIVQRGDIAADQMVGSWAGAMGQTQFLPSNYLAHAEDADGDGKRDLWHSPLDVVASTANLLARGGGWRAGEPWGVEVQLPAGFELGRVDVTGGERRSAESWAAEGLRTVDGAPLPPLADAELTLPAGARGPAFLAGANFRALLRYNTSTSYALAVALLSQRIAGGPAVAAAWPRDQRALTRSEVLALQEALNRRGFDSGAADGLLGPATRAAVRRFQRSAGLPPDGQPDPALLQRLQAMP